MTKNIFKILTAIFTALLFTNSALAQTEVKSQIAATYSDYTYEEPGVMSQWGNMYGIDASLNVRPDEEKPLFFNFQLALNMGEVDYTSNSTGSIDGEENNRQEIRGLVGSKNGKFAPYIGFGIRRLENDSEGMTSTTNNAGYKRVSKYFYVPVGLMVDLISNEDIKIIGKAEYDHLIIGRQTSDQVHINGKKIKNKQTDGYGYRFSLQFLMPIDDSKDVFFEPFYEYWDIAVSDVHLGDYEPQNTTEEFGVKIGLSF